MNIMDDVLATGPSCEMKEAVAVSSPSMLQNLKEKRNNMQRRLDDLDAAIKALEENPNVAKVLELVARVR